MTHQPLRRTRIKICGLTRPGDVQAACELGADAVGFVSYPGSKRYVPTTELPRLAGQLTPWVTPVLLFVNPTVLWVQEALAMVPDALLQFHGSETPEFCAGFGRPYIKAFPALTRADLLKFIALHARALGHLVDAPTVAFGGAGQTFDWEILPGAAERTRPLLLAGGLNPGNVAEAIARARPFGVDVSSGVELSPGIKRADLMDQFMASVRAADASFGAV